MFKKQNNQKKLHKTLFRVIIIVFSILLVLILTLLILVGIGKNKLLNNSSTNIIAPESLIESQGESGKIISYQGQKYEFNEDITNILLIGVDKDNLPQNSMQTFGTNGQADVLLLMSLNTLTGQINAIPISRDSMIDINIYSKSGQFLGVENKQICLSYAYGDGREISCENTVESVSRLLYGIPINSYIAIDINSIKRLNDALGGVTVTLSEDITLYDKVLKKGQSVTLKGEYALGYIRDRDEVDIEANNDRMSRQKNYMKSFFNQALQMTKKDITTPIKLYNIASKYKVTNLSIADVTYLTKCVLLNKDAEPLSYLSISGKTSLGEKYVEFYPDQEKLYQLIIKAFYKPIS